MSLIYQEASNPPCPRCDCTRTRKAGRNSAGKQRYQCVKCYRCWAFGKYKGQINKLEAAGIEYVKGVVTKAICPRCGSNRTKKRGRPYASQVYFCLTCNRCWTQGLFYDADPGLLVPKFVVGDQVKRILTKDVGIVAEVKTWKIANRIAYRIKGNGFHPSHFFSQSTLCLHSS